MENPSIVKKLLANIDLTIKSWHKAQLTFYTLGLAAIQNIFMRRVLKNFLGSRIYKVSSRLRLVSFSRFCYHFQYQFLFQSSPDFSRIFTTRSFPPFLRPYAFSAFLHFPSIYMIITWLELDIFEVYKKYKNIIEFWIITWDTNYRWH